MSANFEEADAAIRQAELLGAAAGWTRMLQGLVSLQRGDHEKAIQDLEHAVRLDPASVAARALLAHAYDVGRRPDRYYSLLGEIDQLRPVTAEDYLFKGLVESGAEPSHGLPSLNEAIGRRPNWSLAYVCRASARASLAMTTGRLDHAQDAVDDARVAKRMLPNNAFALREHLFVHLVAADVLSDLQDEANRAMAIAEAERDMRAMESVIGSPEVYRLRGEYFERAGLEDAALAEYRRSGNATLYAGALYRRGAFGEALQALERLPVRRGDIVGWTYRAFIVMESEDGQRQALAMFQELMRDPPEGLSALHPLMVLLLMGRRADTVAAASDSYERLAEMAPWMFEWYRHLLDYQCQKISAEKLLAEAADSRLHECEAHFHIALNLIADEDRAGAQEHFRAAVDTHVFVYFEYYWSRNFLARLEQDPTWPPWIPVKEDSEPTTQRGGEALPATQPASMPSEGQP